MEKLEFYLLGTLDIRLNNHSIIEFMSVKAIGLLCYLAMNSNRTISREKIVELFWGNSDAEAAKYNLRYTLWTLRKVFKNHQAPNIILNVKNGCKINLEYEVIVDTVNLDNILKCVEKNNRDFENVTLHHIDSIYKGEFFEGFYLKNCPEFNDWIFYEREMHQRKYFTILSELAEYLKGVNEIPKCIQVYEHLIKLNPLQEELYLDLIKLNIQIGDRNSALQYYERCCKVLRSELDIGPMQELQKAYQQIKGGDNIQISDQRRLNVEGNISVMLTNEFEQYLTQKTLKDAIVIYPIEKNLAEIDYYWLSELIDELINKCDRSILQSIPDNYLKDLFIINSRIAEVITPDRGEDKSAFVPDIRLFKSIERFIFHVSSFRTCKICIRNLEWVDEKSFLWLRYLVSKKRGYSINIILRESDCEKHRLLLEENHMLQSEQA